MSGIFVYQLDVCEWLRNAAIGDTLELCIGETVECVNGSLMQYLNDEMTPEQEHDFEVWLLENGTADDWAEIEADVSLRLLINESLGSDGMDGRDAKRLIWVSGKRIKRLLQDMQRLLEYGEMVGTQRVEVNEAANFLDEADCCLKRAYAASIVKGAKFKCGNCDFETNDEPLMRPIRDIFQRVAPGEPMPAGECPHCGALVV